VLSIGRTLATGNTDARNKFALVAIFISKIFLTWWQECYRVDIQRINRTMKAIPQAEKAMKKSVSFPPDLWAFVLSEAGDTGIPSKVIQKAVRLLKETSEKQKNGGQKDFQAAKEEMRKGRDKK